VSSANDITTPLAEITLTRVCNSLQTRNASF
jgi:hypothetical protein